MNAYEHVGKKIVCPDCKGLYLPLGFMRHRTAHRERRAEIKELEKQLAGSSWAQPNTLRRYNKLRKLEGII